MTPEKQNELPPPSDPALASASGSALPVEKRERLKAMATMFPMAAEWQAAVEQLERGNVTPFVKLSCLERQFLEEEIPGLLEMRERIVPTRA